MHTKLTAKKLLFSKENATKFPHDPGVYLFTNNKGKIIYVGKANNLKSRLANYLGSDLDLKTARLVEEIKYLSTVTTTSELEALLLEASLIKKFKPKYNIELKDDKHPLYIVITDDLYPIVKTARKQDLSGNKHIFGPFPSSTHVRNILGLIRKTIPYAHHKVEKRRCIYAHIGLCNPCPSEIEKLENKEKLVQRRKYLQNIRMIKSLLEGKIPQIKSELIKQMNLYATRQEYEMAQLIKERLDSLAYITQRIIPPAKYIENPKFAKRLKSDELKDLKNLLNELGVRVDKLDRIECFDIAHIGGTFPTASMVTFVSGKSEKKFYRHFRIMQKKSTSDTDNLREAITRRSKHFQDWGKPDLIIVDGGAGQVSTFRSVIKDIPVVGIAKQRESLVVAKPEGGYLYREIGRRPALYIVQRLRDEAHRFARRYHHLLFKKNLLKLK